MVGLASLGSSASVNTMGAGWRTCLVIGCIATSGCLLEVSDKFGAGAPDGAEVGAEDSGGTGEGTGDSGGIEPTPDCAEGSLDCDGVPGCEASALAPGTCGSCTHSCIVAGVTHSCEAGGVCSAAVELVALADVVADETQPDQNREGEDSLLVRAEPRCDTFISLPALEFPAEAVVESAILDLVATSAGSGVAVHRVLAPWVAAELTWATRPAVEADPMTTVSPGIGHAEIDLSAAVEAWLGGAANHGVALRTEAVNEAEFRSLETGEGPSLSLELTW